MYFDIEERWQELGQMGEWRRQLQRKVMMASLLGRKRGKKCGSKKERKRLQIKRKQTG
jgi:hypothetical protein